MNFPSKTLSKKKVKFFKTAVPKPAKSPTKTLKAYTNWRSEIYLYLQIKICLKKLLFVGIC